MKYTLMLLSLIVSASALASKNFTSEGRVVVCGARVLQSDLYFLEQDGVETDLGRAGLSYTERFEHLLEVNKPFQHFRMNKLRGGMTTFKKDHRFLDGMALPAISDSKLPGLGKSCHYERAILVTKPTDSEVGHKRFIINRDLWGRMDEDHKTALLLEVLLAHNFSLIGRLPNTFGISRLLRELVRKERNLRRLVEANVKFGDGVFDAGKFNLFYQDTPDESQMTVAGDKISFKNWVVMIYEANYSYKKLKDCYYISNYLSHGEIDLSQLKDSIRNYVDSINQHWVKRGCERFENEYYSFENRVTGFGYYGSTYRFSESVAGPDITIHANGKTYFAETLETDFGGKRAYDFPKTQLSVTKGKLITPDGRVYSGKFVYDFEKDDIALEKDFHLDSEINLAYPGGTSVVTGRSKYEYSDTFTLYRNNKPVSFIFAFDKRNQIVFTDHHITYLTGKEGEITELSFMYRPYEAPHLSELNLGNGLSINVKIARFEKYTKEFLPFIAVDDETLVGHRTTIFGKKVSVYLTKGELYLYRTDGIYTGTDKRIMSF